MELAFLILFLVVKGRGAPKGVAVAGKVGKFIAPAAPAPSGFDEALEELCQRAGLSRTECDALASGKLEEIVGEGAKKLCEYLELPGCSAVGDLVTMLFREPSWLPVHRLNAALNGECYPGMRNQFISVTSGGAVGHGAINYLGGCRVYKNGCVPFTYCPDGWKKCKQGTIPMEKWFPKRFGTEQGCKPA